MKCPQCTHHDTRVIDSRELEDGSMTRRRRECPSCAARFTTYERYDYAGLTVVKKDGRREAFSREKLARGIKKALEKRPLPSDTTESIITGIEQRLHELGRSEVKSQVVGELVLQALRGLDAVAYIRFASVYMAFPDIDVMRKEMEKLLEAEQVAGGGAPGASPATASQAEATTFGG